MAPTLTGVLTEEDTDTHGSQVEVKAEIRVRSRSRGHRRLAANLQRLRKGQGPAALLGPHSSEGANSLSSDCSPGTLRQ